MPEIKWIKITTEMFDDEKIRLIEKMPEADTILIIWIRLICIAGKINAGGQIFLSPELPYNDEDLATILGRPLNTVRLALATFKRYKMIEVDDNGVIYLPNFEKHQNVEGLTKIRQQTQKRVAAYRERQRVKLLPESSHNDGFEAVTLQGVTVTQQNRIEKNRIDKRREEVVIKIWEDVLKNLDGKMNRLNYGALKNTKGVEQTEEEFYIGVPSEVNAKQLEDYSAVMIRRELYDITGLELRPVFVLLEE